MADLRLYNTRTRSIERLIPLHGRALGLYTCGPTVYNFAHIGNLRTYVFEDILRRALEYTGLDVRHVMNVTDVGHLTSDADEGEDKMQVGARREGKTAWDIATFYTDAFFADIAALNIKGAHVICRATDHIAEQIALIRRIEAAGAAYRIEDGIYFDTSTFPSYGELARLDIEGLQAGARVEVVAGKRHKTDFALWKFSKPAERRDMEWGSPWGRGFPGWHIECSAMSMKYLGEQFDIHTGGIDHVPVHHTNEIAQSETATGKRPWVNFWLHGEFLVLDRERMGKSLGNFITLRTLTEKGYHPLAYRYLCLTAHYRKQLTFSFDALEGAVNSYNRLREVILMLKGEAAGRGTRSKAGQPHLDAFDAAVSDDLNVPEALAELWNLLRDEKLPAAEKLGGALAFDEVLGLGIAGMEEARVEIPTEVDALLLQREAARKAKEWKRADELRQHIGAAGFEIQDTDEGPKLRKKKVAP